MISVRSWLVSGTFVVGLGAGMLCGAGIAAADAGGDEGSARPAARSADTQPADRGAGRTVGIRSAATVARVPAAATKSAPKPTKKTPAAAGAVNAPVTTFAATTSTPKAAVVKPAVTPAPAAAAQSVPVVPSSVPVDPAKFAGTYYEQGSVKQFFSIGLVNTKATYTLNPDGTIKVQNSGNYFFNRGPRSSITGSAVSVNETNTALNVGFFSPRPPSATPPGNYTILENAPDYSWVLVSDPSGRSGYILTRSKTISPAEYQQFVDQSKSLGVKGRITPTRQF